MGKNFIDKFTYLHFGSGIVSYYWGLSLFWWVFVHTIFEILENSKKGVYIIDNYLTLWPGGKQSSDSFINSLGDTFAAVIGWISAYYISGER